MYKQFSFFKEMTAECFKETKEVKDYAVFQKIRQIWR